MLGFVASAPLSSSSNRLQLNTCHTHRITSPPLTTRRTKQRQTQTPVSRVRRGQRPAPEIPDSLSLYDIEPIHDIDYNKFDFSTLKGRVTLVVNVASDDEQFSESTYRSFAALLDKYHDAGFDILAFPNNWFGQRETRSHEEIKKHIHSKYSDKIKLFAKSDMDWNAVFGLGRMFFPGEVVWNFHGKYLFGRKGLPVARFDLLTTHDYLDSQVGMYVNNEDPSIHLTEAPDSNTSNDVDDYEFLRGRADFEQIEVDEKVDSGNDVAVNANLLEDSEPEPERKPEEAEAK